MTTDNDLIQDAGYDRATITLHWLTAMLVIAYAVTERRCIQGGLTPAYSDHRGRMIRSGVTNGCAG